MRTICKNDVEPFVEADMKHYLISEDRKHLWSKRGRCIMSSSGGRGFFVSPAVKGRARYWVVIRRRRSAFCRGLLLLLALALALALALVFFMGSQKIEAYKDLSTSFIKDDLLPAMSQYAINVRGWAQARAQVFKLQV
jgi:hypothetical protein